MAAPLPFVTEQQVKELLSYPELIVALEQGFAEFSKNDESVVQPVRTVIPVKDHNGFLGSMPAYMKGNRCLATKLVTFYPGNKDCSTHHAIILLFDCTNGKPMAALEGEEMTAMRTAAASAVATKYLAPKDTKVLAIIGSGVEARSHYAALTAILKFDEVRVYSRNPDNAARCAADLGPEARAVSSAQEAARDADVIVTVTFSPTPVLEAAWVKPGAHVNAVGACRPDWQEIDPALMRAAAVYVDSREAAYKEAGDIVMCKAEVYAELGEMVLGTKEAKRNETTVFKSLGMAIEDAVAGDLVYKAWCKQQQPRL